MKKKMKKKIKFKKFKNLGKSDRNLKFKKKMEINENLRLYRQTMLTDGWRRR